MSIIWIVNKLSYLQSFRGMTRPQATFMTFFSSLSKKNCQEGGKSFVHDNLSVRLIVSHAFSQPVGGCDNIQIGCDYVTRFSNNP